MVNKHQYDAKIDKNLSSSFSFQKISTEPSKSADIFWKWRPFNITFAAF